MVWALRRAKLATGGLYPVATLATAALAFGGADALHGSGFLAVYIAGLGLGTAGIPRPADGDGVPSGARVGRAGDDVPRARAARVPVAPAATSRWRAPCWRSSRSWSRGRWRSPCRRSASATRGPSGSVLRWAGCAAPSRRAGDVPGDRRREGLVGDLGHRLLRGADLDAARPGPELRARRGACWGRRRPSPRCRGRWPRRARSAGWAPRSSSTGSPPTTRPSGARVRDLGLPREAS